MAIITKVSAQKRPGRYNIFLDERYAFSASEKTVAEFVLLKGQELSDEDVVKIKQFDTDAKATDLASTYLSYEPRTVFEILQYLKKHGIADESAQAAVMELSELGFLDDREYVRLFVKNNLRIGSDGPRSLLQKLGQKGVDPDISQLEIAEVAQSDWLQVGKRVIKSTLHQAGKVSTRELTRKLKSKLLSHGFDSATSDLVVEQLDLAEDADQQLEALKKQGIKAYKRFRRLAEGPRNVKIKNYLFTHGFSTSEINSFLAGEIIPLDELAEY